MADLNELKKGQTITEHIDTINENVSLINDEINEMKNAQSGGVTSVNGKTGEVILNSKDVGAFPNSTSIRELDINNIKDTGVYIGTNANNPYYLIVIKYNDTNIYQEIIGLNTKKYRRFTGTWSEWVNPYSVENPIGASDIMGINAFDENKEIEVALLNDGTFVKANLTLNPSTMTLKLGNQEIASKNYVDERLNSISSVIVNELPETGVANTIYFVPSGAGGDNEFNEWIWVNDEWEIIGGTSIDLTPFLPRQEASETYATKLENDNKVSKTTTINNKPLSSNITLTAEDVGALPSDTKIETNAVAKYTNEEISTKLSNGEFVNGDTFVALDDGTYKKGHIYLYNNGLVDITNFVDTTNDQSIGGIKNFTGLLKYLGDEVATEKYVQENGGKIDTISVNGTNQEITNKNVDIIVPTDYITYEDSVMIEPQINELLEKIYPVGSIYMSVNNVSPQEFLGGTWERIQDTFLLGAGSSYSAGSTGGEATHTLTVNEMPAHGHRQRANHDSDQITSANRGYGSGGGWSLKTDAYGTNYYQGTANTGGGQAHNNMPPYLAVYMWQRIG